MNKNKVYIFDSTLRDGAQAKGISFSLSDKLHMLKLLDSLGIDYIEAGNPASNPKEKIFFEKAKEMKLEYAKLTAFGSTRRKNCCMSEDPGIQALLSADTDVVAIFGKTWDMHVTHVLQTTLEENLNMVKDTISFFKEKGKEVVFDAEHFFDGYKANPSYAISVLKAAQDGGADCLVLCDTNGGTLTHEVEAVMEVVNKNTRTMIGIHAHNDSETAVSNSVAAVLHGARHVQGTFIGFGERCGNARLTSIIPNLQLKMGYKCIPEEKIVLLTSAAREAAEISNAALEEKLPYVGHDALTRLYLPTRLNTGIYIALIAAFVAYLILWKTRRGYELRAVGLNPQAAEYGGINVARNTVIAMAISGALAGLAGTEQILGLHNRFILRFSPELGFMGIAVALLGKNHPVGVVFAAILFGALQAGSAAMDRLTAVPRELITIIQALIIFFVAAEYLIRRMLRLKEEA